MCRLGDELMVNGSESHFLFWQLGLFLGGLGPQLCQDSEMFFLPMTVYVYGPWLAKRKDGLG